jgi:hypothetical protein
MELIYIADVVIVTVERMVDKCERTTNSFLIPSPGVTYIAHAPRGAFPTSCYPDYLVSGGEFLRYIDACNAGQFEDYVAEIPD